MEIKQKIKAKFGSIPRFAKLAGLQTSDIFNLMRRNNQERIDELSKICDIIEAKAPDNAWLPEYGQQVKAQLQENFGTIGKFIALHPDFTHNYISMVIHNRRKSISHKMARLIRIGNIELKKLG